MDDQHQALSDAIGDLRDFTFRLGKGCAGSLEQRADEAVARIWRAVAEIERRAAKGAK